MYNHNDDSLDYRIAPAYYLSMGRHWLYASSYVADGLQVSKQYVGCFNVTEFDSADYAAYDPQFKIESSVTVTGCLDWCVNSSKLS